MQIFGSFSDWITNTECIPCSVWKDSSWYQPWHTDVVSCISLTSQLIVIHKAASVVHSAAHSPKAWIIICIVNNDKHFLYIHHINKLVSSHCASPALSIYYWPAGSWHTWVFIFASPPSEPHICGTQMEHPANLSMYQKITQIVFTTWNGVKGEVSCFSGYYPSPCVLWRFLCM